MKNKVIECLGYKMFEGTMLVKDINTVGIVWSARIITGTWLYLPKTDMWVHKESNVLYNAKRCEIAE
jgi:hypothetical protein